MNSMRLPPPRPPGERVRPVAAATEMLCTAEKVSVFGAKRVCSASRAARFRLCLPLEGKVPEGRMRCSAIARYEAKVTFSFENCSASGTYTSSPPAGGAVSLRLGQARVLVPTGNQFNTAPLLRSPRGETKVEIVPRG